MPPGVRDRTQQSGVPRQVSDEPTVPISYRPTQTRAGFGLLRSVLFGLLWLLLAGLVAMLVVWVLPERQPERQPERPNQQLNPSVVSPAMGLRPELTKSPRPMSKPSTPALPSSAAAPPATSVAVPLQPVTAASTSIAPSVAPTSPQPATTSERPLSAAERAAWQQDLANIEFVASTYAAQVRACYERSVRGLGGEPPRGRVELVFTLSDEGLAQNVAVSDDTLGLPVLQACLSQRVSEWRFPRPVGPLRTFRFPFAFSGSKP
jgi:hypothetical protein